jgi:hypothetical protein
MARGVARRWAIAVGNTRKGPPYPDRSSLVSSAKDGRQNLNGQHDDSTDQSNEHHDDSYTADWSPAPRIDTWLQTVANESCCISSDIQHEAG